MRPTALAHRDFRLLLTGTTISALGSWLLVIAVPYQIFRLTGSATATGLALAIESLPALLAGPWAGVLVDRWPRRRTTICANLAAAMAVLPIMAAGSTHHVALVYAGLLAENLAVVFLRPAARALTPEIVGTGPDLAAANSITAAIAGITRLVGPALGALLLSAGGITTVVAIDAASYLLAAGAAILLHRRPPRPPPTAEPAVVRELADGLRLLGTDPMLRGLLVTSALFLTANAALTALLVPFAVDRLGVSGSDTGYLITGLGVGYVTGAAINRRLSRRCDPRTVICAAQAAVGTCFLALFATTSLPLAILAAGATGVPGVILLTTVQTQVQRTTPSHLLGRVGAAYLASDAGATVLGALLGPAIVAATGLSTALLLISAAALISTPASMILLPRARSTPENVARRVGRE